MKWIVRSEYNGQIDNTYGVFYAPMNITNLRVVLTFQSIELSYDDMTYIIYPTCCDLQDFNFKKKYSPYIFFDQLGVSDGK